MYHTTNQLDDRKRRVAIAAVCVFLTSALTVGSASAQPGFKVALSSNELVLANPNDAILRNIASWDSPLMRVIARSRPFIEVLNTSTVETLTSVTFDIGDTNFNFSDQVLGAPAVLGATSTPGFGIIPTATNNGDVLTIDFTNGGIAPQTSVRFQVDIDPDPGFANAFIHPDYRTVLYDLFENDTTDNTVFTATFSNGQNASITLPDVPNPPGPVFANGNIRPYAVEELVDFIDPPAVVIPEPCGGTLALLATLALGASRKRRRV